MAKYTFKCPSCGATVQKYTSVKTIPCSNPECEDVHMKRQMPNLTGQEVRETVDSYTGTTWTDNHKVKMYDRSREYYWRVEVPRMVQSGTYCEQTMFENGWIYYDEKGNMQIHTKPPSHR